MKVKRHNAAELKRFLVAVDRALTRRVSLIVIGGSALSLGYGVTSVTTDIDTYGGVVATGGMRDIDTFGHRTASASDGPAGLDAIDDAARTARADTGLDIPIAESTIAQFTDGFETRLLRVLPDLERLELWVPELRPCSRQAPSRQRARSSTVGGAASPCASRSIDAHRAVQPASRELRR